jgi:metal-responsive CopG/Arc/MetJ family transcriptional regulator
MAAVKTAISLDESLLAGVDALARKLDLPRSRVLAVAAEELLARYENRDLLDRLNRVYAEPPTDDEREAAKAMRQRLRRRAQSKW